MGENKRRKTSIVRHILILLVTVFLAAYASHSWMKREWTPSIKSDDNGIYIATGSSLAFIFDDGASMGAEINELLRTENFEFKSVSNFSGKSEDFYSLIYSSDGVGYETYHNIKKNELQNNTVDSMKWTELGKEYGYIELQFKVVSPGTDDKNPRYIYIDESSFIEDADPDDDIDPTKCLRISISSITKVNNVYTQKDIMFCADSRTNEVHAAVTDELIEGNTKVADGQNRCVMVDNQVQLDEHGNPVEQETVIINNKEYELIRTGRKLNRFSEYNGETPEKCLFSMDENKEQTIVVRIWIEGVDDDCVDAIAGKAIKLLLKFSSKTFQISQ